MEAQKYKVFARVDAQGCISEVNSDAFLDDVTGWVELDSDVPGDRGHHAQGNYFPLPLRDGAGVCRYAFAADAEDGDARWRERTAQEMEQSAQDLAQQTAPSMAERLAALEDAMMAMLMGGEA